MDEKQYDIQAAKDILYSYRDYEREIENKTELLERLTVKLEGVGAQNITDMPRAPSPANDRISDLISQKIEVEEMLTMDIEKFREKRRYIRGLIRSLRSADEREVIRFRYLVGMEWYDVTDAMFGAKQDYLAKADSYQRRTYSIHARALNHIAAFIEGDHTK